MKLLPFAKRSPSSVGGRVPMFAAAMKYRSTMVAIAECYIAARSIAELLKRGDNSLRLHPLAEFEVNLASLHQPVLPDDELRRHRQEISRVAVILFQIDANVLIKALHFGADPEDQAERKRVSQIDVAQHRKRQIVLLRIVCGEGCAV